MCSINLQSYHPFSCCSGSFVQKRAETANLLNGDPNNIKNFSIVHPDTSLETSNVNKGQAPVNTLNYNDYLTSVQECFRVCKNKGDYFFIQHVSMDKDGNSG